MTLQEAPPSLIFDDFRLERGGLFRLDHGNRKPVALGSRALDLLWVLAERAGEIVTKETIFQTVWAGTTVEEVNLTVQISALRRVIDQYDSKGSCIQTLPGRGYRFVATVTTPETKVVAASAENELRNKPSIAVLPFTNLSNDSAQDYFADGTVEEIITALSRIRWLFVMARNSTFTYKGRAVDVKQVGQELGVRYVLEGSVRKAADRVRITGQLLDAETGGHLWADRFDGSLENIIDLQDQVAISVAGVIEPTLRAVEIRRAVERPRPDPTAYDLYLRALRANDTWEKQDYLEALDRLSQAIEQDADYGPALALSAFCHMILYNNRWIDNPEAARQQAVSLARRAIRSAGNDAETLSRAAYILGRGKDVDLATVLIDQSLRINPSYAQGWLERDEIRLIVSCIGEVV